MLSETLKEADIEMARDVYEAVISCVDYVNTVVTYESCHSIMRNVLNAEAYREKMIELDVMKKKNLRIVTLSLQILHKYCKLNDMEQIFKGNLDNRLEIAEFAVQLVNSMCQTN